MSETEDPEINEAGETESKDAAASSRRLTEKEWAEIKDLYERGLGNITALAAKFGVSRQSINKRFQKIGKPVFGSRANETQAAVTKAVEKVVSEFAEKRAERIEQTRNETYNGIRNYTLVARRKVKDCIDAGNPLGAIGDEIKVIERLVKMEAMGGEARLRILNADALVDEASLPVLELRDITLDEIEKIQKSDEIDDESDELTEADLAQAIGGNA